MDGMNEACMYVCMYVLEENDYWGFWIFCWAMEEWNGMEWYYFVLYRVISYIHTRMPLGE